MNRRGWTILIQAICVFLNVPAVLKDHWFGYFGMDMCSGFLICTITDVIVTGRK